MAYDNVTNALTAQKLPDMRTQIMNRWGSNPNWNNPSVDLAGDLARLFEANGISDLSKLNFKKREYETPVQEWETESGTQRTGGSKRTTFDVLYGDQNLGFLGDINRDGSLSKLAKDYLADGSGPQLTDRGDNGPIIGWSSRGGGHTNFNLVENPQTGEIVVAPTWGSSKTNTFNDIRGIGSILGLAAGAYYGLGAGAGAGADQVALMAANGMTDAEIAAALGSQGAQAAGLAGVGGGAVTSTAASNPGLWDTIKQGASSLASFATQGGGGGGGGGMGGTSWVDVAKDALPLVGAAATLASGGSVTTPQVPDYVKQAIATGNAGKYNEQTPYGTVTWSLRPGADPANPQPGDYIRSTNFSPEQQKLYEQNTANQLTAGQVGGQQLADLGQGRQAVQDALYRRATQYYDQNFGDQENQLRTRLANQGLNEGTEAFEREMRNFRQTRDSAYSDATDRAIAGADQQENNAVARIVNILNMSKATAPTSGNSAGGAGTDLLTAANQAYTANLGASNAQAARDAQQQNALLQLVLGGMKYYGG